MLVYPQLATGALGQYPIRKQRRMHTVVNSLADGSLIRLADPAAEITEWNLQYDGLNDAELAALQDFHAAAEGTLNAFTFVDPTGNLVAQSGALDNAAWSKGPLLTVAGGAADPTGGTAAWSLANAAAGAQSITQTLATPSAYVYCLSVYARAAQSVTVTLLRGSERRERTIGTAWRRIVSAGSSASSTDSIAFGLELPAASTVEVFGFQVEPQGSPSIYKATTTAGVYENARLRDDEFSSTTTGLNCHSATVNIIHANHL